MLPASARQTRKSTSRASGDRVSGIFSLILAVFFVSRSCLGRKMLKRYSSVSKQKMLEGRARFCRENHGPFFLKHRSDREMKTGNRFLDRFFSRDLYCDFCKKNAGG